MAEDYIARMMAVSAMSSGGGSGDSYTKAETDELLDGKADLVDGKVPASELPSYVDDTIEGYYYEGAFYEDSEHTIAITGENGKIYIDLTANKSYRWTGTVYVRIDECPAFGETQGTIYEGNKGKANADNIGTLSSLTTTAKTSLVAAINELDSDKVDAVSGKVLSSNDFTDEDKTKLSGIAAGAEVNVQSDWTQTDTDTDDYIKNKPTLGTAAAANTTTSIAFGDTGVPTSETVYTDQQRQDSNILAIQQANGRKNLVVGFGQIENNGCIFTYGSDGVITVTGTKSGALAIAEIISNEDLSKYGLSAGDSIVSISDNENVGVTIIFVDSQGTQDSAISLYNETRTITIPSGRIKWYLRIQVKPTVTGTINETTKPMVCDKNLYDIDPTVTPYAPTNRELYEMILELQNGGNG